MISKLDNEASVDYHYGSALESFRIHPRGESAIRSALVRGSSPMDSLGLRTDSMLDCLELLDTVAAPTAVTVSPEGWLDFPPPLVGRHPDDEGDLEDDALDDEEELDGEEFDDEEDEFEDEDFEDDEDEEIDEELDDEIEDIDIDEEDDDFDDDEDLDELDEEEDEDLEDL
jgi:hypothetical protein